MKEISPRRPTIRVQETEQSIVVSSAKPGTAPSQEPWRSRSRCKSDGTTWSSFADKPQLKRPMDPKSLGLQISGPRWNEQAPAPGGKRTVSGKLQTSMRKKRKAEAAAKEAAMHVQRTKSMELDEFGDLDDREDPAPDPTAEARIQASIDEQLPSQGRGDREVAARATKPPGAASQTSLHLKRRTDGRGTLNYKFWSPRWRHRSICPRRRADCFKNTARPLRLKNAKQMAAARGGSRTSYERSDGA